MLYTSLKHTLADVSWRNFLGSEEAEVLEENNEEAQEGHSYGDNVDSTSSTSGYTSGSEDLTDFSGYASEDLDHCREENKPSSSDEEASQPSVLVSQVSTMAAELS
jgi:hypothetical protein